METVLGIGGLFFRAKEQAAGPTVFAPFPSQTEYFGDAKQMWMVNFARLHDPEGNPIELWEPPQLATA